MPVYPGAQISPLRSRIIKGRPFEAGKSCAPFDSRVGQKLWDGRLNVVDDVRQTPMVGSMAPFRYWQGDVDQQEMTSS
jgi:hypothetical protein